MLEQSAIEKAAKIFNVPKIEIYRRLSENNVVAGQEDIIIDITNQIKKENEHE